MNNLFSIEPYQPSLQRIVKVAQVLSHFSSLHSKEVVLSKIKNTYVLQYLLIKAHLIISSIIEYNRRYYVRLNNYFNCSRGHQRLYVSLCPTKLELYVVFFISWNYSEE